MYASLLRPRLRPLLLLAAVLLAPQLEAVSAARYGDAVRAGRVTGRVVDASTDEPLTGANVFLAGTTIGASTDLDGYYTIPAVPAGAQTVVVTYIGYERAEQAVTAVDGETVEADFALRWAGMQGEEIVITAQAEGQVAAINQQLGSNTITNIVSGDRIRELPDVNAAESIGRLPGVSIQRSGGEANKVAIRGLSPKYNTVTVNGVRVPATGGDDRSVDLSLISSNMLDGIEVVKALTPDRDADAIGGAIDLKLREASAGFALDATAQGGYNALQDVYGNYKVSGNASDRFFSDRVGLIASFSADAYDRSADKFSGSYRQEGEGAAAEARILAIDLRDDAQVRGRVGGSLVADVRVPAGKVLANAFYNRLRSDGLGRSNRYDLENQRHRYALSDHAGRTSIATFAASVEQSFARVAYDAGVSHTRSDRESPENYYWDFMEEGAYDTRILDEEPRPIDIPDAFYDELDDTYLVGFSVSDARSEESETMGQLNVKVPYRLGRRVAGYVKAGGKLRVLDRSNDENSAGNGLFYGGSQNLRNILAEQAPELGLEVGAAQVPLRPFVADYARDNFLAGDYWLGYPIDPDRARVVTNTLRDYLNEDYSASRRRDYRGEERLRAGYVMAELRLGDLITFLPGIRWEHEASEYDGQFVREVGQGQTLVAVDTTTTRSNTFALPMVHLQIRPAGWLGLRLAYTETLTRPDYMQYAPITFVNQFGSWVQAGNPSLTPAHATNLDASLSLHGTRLGLFTVSVFSKTIDDLIVPVNFPLLAGQQILPELEVPGVRGVPIVSSAANNPFAAEVRGVEFDYQTNLWYLPSALKGIVLGLNYTRVTSDVEVPRYFLERERIPAPPFFRNSVKDSSRVGRLPDQPSHIANVTLGYDVGGFSARASLLYQTDALSFFGNTAIDDTFTDDYVRWDLSVKQELGWGAQVFANLNNVNARPDRTFRAELGRYPSYVEYYGFSMDVGLRYRY